MSSRQTLYYDGQCPLCTAEINHLRRLKGDELDLIDVHGCGQQGLPSRREMLEKLHYRDADGRLLVGLDANIAKEFRVSKGLTSFWLSGGLDGEGIKTLMQTLQAQGGLTFYNVAAEDLPLLLNPPRQHSTKPEFRITAPPEIPDGLPVTVQAIGENGRVLDRQIASLKGDDLPAKIIFDLPEALRNDIRQIRIENRKGAGGVYLLDERFHRRSVGIVAPPGEAESAPLIKASYYLTRALEPYASIKPGDTDALLNDPPAMIVLPDVGSMTVDELNRLEEWIKEGGLLLRFAGPNLASTPDPFLTPVPLRRGGRALDGALTWEKPVRLAPFPETSPFYGLRIPGDITVKRQVLAEPVSDLEDKTWALLEDGTPLITASSLGDGTLVLIHTTATAEWSDLSLSGLYVDILRRLSGMAGTRIRTNSTSGVLQPLAILDGFGRLGEPGPDVLPVPAEELENIRPGADHPPGIYGRAGYSIAFNLGDNIRMVEAVPSLPLGVEARTYGLTHETDLMPHILTCALILLLADWLIMIALSSGIFWRRMAVTTALLLIFCMPAYAQDELQYADDLYLAYIQTGDPSVDGISFKGLQSLADVLTTRTSVEPAGVAAVNPERDTLAFFPLIYWTVTDTQKPLSDKALQNIQSYLDQGGTILFDTRDAGSSSDGFNRTLRAMVGSLDIPPLVPVPEDHVLGKSFYLLKTYPGLYEGGTLWVEEQSAGGRDGVSSVIIGGNNWAAAWAAGVNSGNRQHEMAARFGVNLVMYALTGNYKADQVHMKHILERLGH